MSNPERRAAGTRRLTPGHVYFDLDHPDRGPFVATGDEEFAPNANLVDQAEMDETAWEQLVNAGWGTFEAGAGDRACDPGAFGQEDDPRSDMLNAAPPGVGEGLTPVESEEERGRG